MLDMKLQNTTKILYKIFTVLLFHLLVSHLATIFSWIASLQVENFKTDN